jgi:hypothetical protein
MFRAPTRIALAAALVVGLTLLAGCAGRSSGPLEGQPSGPTSVRIERTYMLLNASPFETTGDAATAATLYADLQALSPDPGQIACPGDVGVHYTITVMGGSKQLMKATAIYGGCRVVLMDGKSFSGTGAAGRAFWSALFDAVGPAGQPDQSTGSSGSAS